MLSILVIHEVREFNSWKKAFDAHHKFRTDSGEISAQVFRSQKKPNEVIVLGQWASLEQAEKFAASDNLKEAMLNAGVIGKPTILFLNKV